jgi:hypothetical protein
MVEQKMLYSYVCYCSNPTVELVINEPYFHESPKCPKCRSIMTFNHAITQ